MPADWQLVERRTNDQKIVGSNPALGSQPRPSARQWAMSTPPMQSVRDQHPVQGELPYCHPLKQY